MTSVVKRGRGRPRKDGKVIVKNPDCEVATKGYVKCVGRTVIATSDHSHCFEDVCTTMPVIAACALTAFLGLCGWLLFNGTKDMFGASVSASVFSMAVLLSVFVWVFSGVSTTSTDKRSIPKTLIKYTPPVCEPKKGCDGE